MYSYPAQDFFVLSTKDKLWFVTTDNAAVNVTEFKNPKLERFSINFPSREVTPILGLSNISPAFEEMAKSPAEADFKIVCRPEDLKQMIGSKDSIQPDEFYSLKELQKISKMMIRKLERL